MNSSITARLEKTYWDISRLFFPPLILIVLLFLSAPAGTHRVVQVNRPGVITTEKDGRQQTIQLVGTEDFAEKCRIGAHGGDVCLKATRRLAELALNRDVTIETWGRSPHGHVVAVVFFGDANLNRLLARDGYADLSDLPVKPK